MNPELNRLKNNVIPLVTILYLGIISLVMLFRGLWLTPDQFLIIGLAAAVLLAKPLKFLRDWVPFLFLLLAYEYLRGLAPLLGGKVHIYPLILADQFLFFGKIPPVELQRLFYQPGIVQVQDYLATFVYMSHFVLPLAFGFFLWSKDRHEFKLFSTSLIFLSYAGFFTYVIYPAAPPWLASQQGIIGPINDVIVATTGRLTSSPLLPTIYDIMNPNPVAPLPSLHAAYPMLVYLFLRKRYGPKVRLFLVYLASVIFSVIYTGNHYFIDVLAGFLYAWVTFHVISHADRYLTRNTLAAATQNS